VATIQIVLKFQFVESFLLYKIDHQPKISGPGAALRDIKLELSIGAFLKRRATATLENQTCFLARRKIRAERPR